MKRKEIKRIANKSKSTVNALVKDLGKKKSLALSGSVFAWYLLCFVVAIVAAAGNSFGSVLVLLKAMSIIKSATMFVFAALLLVMTIAKYQDKDARGTT